MMQQLGGSSLSLATQHSAGVLLETRRTVAKSSIRVTEQGPTDRWSLTGWQIIGQVDLAENGWADLSLPWQGPGSMNE